MLRSRLLHDDPTEPQDLLSKESHSRGKRDLEYGKSKSRGNATDSGPEDGDEGWMRQGSPRWLIRELEGDSSDTWVNSEGKRCRREWADPVERALDLGVPEMMGLVPHAKMGKGVGVGNVPVVKTEEDLLHRGWGVQEYRQLDFDHLVKAPSIKECMDETKALSMQGIFADELRNASEVSKTGYFGCLSDLNWSPKERVLYDIPTDPQHAPEGMSAVHLRPHISAQEFLGITKEDLSSSAPEVFVPHIDTTGLEV